MQRNLILLRAQINRLRAPSSTATTIPQCLHSCFSTTAATSSSTGTGTTTSTSPPPPPFSSLQEQYRKDILDAALQNVHQHGWTEDAIAHGIVSNKSKYPPSFIGMMHDNHSKASDLIHYFMKDCNLKLKVYLDHLQSVGRNNETKVSTESESSAQIMTHAELLEYGIKHRLEMVLPFVQSSRWSEGMALGATPYNAMSTASHLEELVSALEQALLKIPSAATATTATNLSPLERTAIGAVYVTTELHLLADTSPGYQDTWKFLHDRIQELNWIQKQSFLQGIQNTNGLPPMIPQMNQDTIIAGVAVASSLGSAVLSLMTPVARTSVSAMAGTVVPQVMNFMSYASSTAAATAAATTSSGATVGNGNTAFSGTAAGDYDVSDLPPFDTDGGSSNNGTVGSNTTMK